VPFYGPTRRAIRGKSERRSVEALSTRAWRRAEEQAYSHGEHAHREGEHSPIQAREFDTVCLNCSRRVRIRLPSG
jgi:hypothetical protein